MNSITRFYSIMISFLLILLFFASEFRAQNQEIQWVNIEGYEQANYIGQHENKHYVSSTSKEKFNIKQYDQELNLNSEQTIDTQDDDYYLDEEYTLKTKSGFFAFGNHYDKQKKSLDIFAYSLQNGKFSGPDKIVSHEFSGIQKFADYTNHFNPMTVSPNGEKVVYVNSQKSSKGSNNRILHIATFNDKLEEEWVRQVELNYPEKELYYNDHFIRDDGNIFLLFRYFPPASGKIKFDSHRYAYKVFVISQESEQEYLINLEGEKLVKHAQLIPTKNMDQVVIAGFYAIPTSSEKEQVRGNFVFKVNPQTQETKIEDLDFSSSKKYRELSKSSKIKSKSSNNFRMASAYIFENGNKAFVGEFTALSGNPQKVGYNCTDIYLMVYNPSNELIELNITERMDQGSLRYPECKVVGQSEQLYILFGENINAKRAQKWGAEGKGMAIGLLTLDDTGKVSSELLFITDYGLPKVRPHKTYLFDKDMILLTPEFRKIKTSRLGKLNLE